MKRYDYRYVQCHLSEIDKTLSTYAQAGYRVHTFNRNPNASVVDILLEREMD